MTISENNVKNYIKYKVALWLVNAERWVEKKKSEEVRRLGGVRLEIDLSSVDFFKKSHQLYVKRYEIEKYGKSHTYPETK